MLERLLNASSQSLHVRPPELVAVANGLKVTRGVAPPKKDGGIEKSALPGRRTGHSISQLFNLPSRHTQEGG